MLRTGLLLERCLTLQKDQPQKYIVCMYLIVHELLNHKHNIFNTIIIFEIKYVHMCRETHTFSHHTLDIIQIELF